MYNHVNIKFWQEITDAKLNVILRVDTILMTIHIYPMATQISADDHLNKYA